LYFILNYNFPIVNSLFISFLIDLIVFKKKSPVKLQRAFQNYFNKSFKIYFFNLLSTAIASATPSALLIVRPA